MCHEPNFWILREKLPEKKEKGTLGSPTFSYTGDRQTILERVLEASTKEEIKDDISYQLLSINCLMRYYIPIPID